MNLPEDCLIEVLSRLQFDGLIRFSQTNKTFLTIVRKNRWNCEVKIRNENLIKYIIETYSFSNLNFTGCREITDSGLKSLTNCTSLNLSFCKNITDSGLKSLVNCTSLNLTYCYGITDEGLKSLTNCASLNLSYCNKITDLGLGSLTNCTSLNLSHCKKITKGAKTELRKRMEVIDI